eukprot:15449223-Alexandrium_andersonii.AAC.1
MGRRSSLESPAHRPRWPAPGGCRPGPPCSGCAMGSPAGRCRQGHTCDFGHVVWALVGRMILSRPLRGDSSHKLRVHVCVSEPARRPP